jgi:hypothetical protein
MTTQEKLALIQKIKDDMKKLFEAFPKVSYNEKFLAQIYESLDRTRESLLGVKK